MLDFIERLRAKPEHVRRRIAFGTSAGVTGVVAVSWLGLLLASGSFSLTPDANAQAANGAVIADSAQSAKQVAAAAGGLHSTWQQFMGVVSGATTTVGTTQPNLTIVDGETTSTLDQKQQSAAAANQTSISF